MVLNGGILGIIYCEVEEWEDEDEDGACASAKCGGCSRQEYASSVKGCLYFLSRNCGCEHRLKAWPNPKKHMGDRGDHAKQMAVYDKIKGQTLYTEDWLLAMALERKGVKVEANLDIAERGHRWTLYF